jgi:hypothetical protein
MLLEHKMKWCMITPTKCATLSVERMFDGWELVRPRHQSLAPKGYKVFMMVRNPYDRIFSAWKFLHKTGYWPPVNDCQCFGDYLELVRHYREHRGVRPARMAPWVWTNTLSEIASYLDDPTFIRVENMEEDMLWHGLPFKPIHINTSPPGEMGDYDHAYLDEWCSEDMRFYESC